MATEDIQQEEEEEEYDEEEDEVEKLKAEGHDDEHDILTVVHDIISHLLTLESIPMPHPYSADEHVIEVHAVALTNGELSWPEPATASLPIPGYEMSGTVVLAPGSSPFQPGTEVYACTAFGREGNAREFTVALTSELGQKPENLSWEEAATVPMSALTAWQALFVHGGLDPPPSHLVPASPSSQKPPRPSSTLSSTAARTSSRPRLRRPRSIISDVSNADKRVLITAAAGGVGLWAVQLARLAGVGHITATCGPANIEFVRSLGANRVVDYTAVARQSGGGSLTDSHRHPSSQTRYASSSSDKYDLVLDCVGGDTLRRAWRSVRHGGCVISVAMPAESVKPKSGVGMGVKSVWFTVRPNSQQLQIITQLIESEKVKVAFDSAFPLEQYEAAIEKAYSGHLRGKVVLRLI